MRLSGFDATAQDAFHDSTLLPEGRYTVVIADTRERENSKGTGSFLEIRFEVIEGQYSGTSVWTRLNPRHENCEVVRIAKSELAAICRAVDVLRRARSQRPRNNGSLHSRCAS